MNTNYPKYQCHKEVSAAKITGVENGADGSCRIHLAGGFDSVVFSHEEMKRKQKPETGWWLVVYADGFQTFSPAKAFEEGYTLIGGNNAIREMPAQNAGTTAQGSEFGRRRGDAGGEELEGEPEGEGVLDEVAASGGGRRGSS